MGENGLSLMRLPTRNFLVTAALAGAVGLVVVASVGDMSGLFGGAVLCLLLAAAVGFLRVDRRMPGESETQAFIAGVLQRRGYAGAFRIQNFTQVASPGIEPGNVRVKFRGELAFHEALYQPAAPPADAFKGLSPRKVEWLRKNAELLERELGGPASGLPGRAPMDPYRATFVAVRKAGGWSMPFTGSAWATLQDGGWAWDLRNLSQSVDTLVVHGKPLGAYPAAVVLASAEGKTWLAGCLAAWRDFEAELGTLQQQLEERRADRARGAVNEFFDKVQAGTTFWGPGESTTQQVAGARYCLEFLATDPGRASVAFTVRSDRHWSGARPFTGQVAFDPTGGRVTIAARTQASDAQRNAGPVLSVATAFNLELHWLPGAPARLEGAAVDLNLRLAHVSPEELERIVDRVHARERAISAAISPGMTYRGTVALPREERAVKVDFVAATTPAGGSARVESGDWSGMFRVAVGESEAGYDVALEAVAKPGTMRSAVDAPAPELTPDRWERLYLKLNDAGFGGMAVSGNARLPIAHLNRTSTPPA